MLGLDARTLGQVSMSEWECVLLNETTTTADPTLGQLRHYLFMVDQFNKRQLPEPVQHYRNSREKA